MMSSLKCTRKSVIDAATEMHEEIGPVSTIQLAEKLPIGSARVRVMLKNAGWVSTQSGYFPSEKAKRAHFAPMDFNVREFIDDIRAAALGLGAIPFEALR